jgi:WD40 repeat protein
VLPPSPAHRPGEGSLLPLWKFQSEKSKRRQVTSICWNPLYDDMFAVGYGSYEFLKQASGLINIYSLKNPSHPEYTFHTESGVMCVHFHPEYANLLAVGCYDGTVLVYDVRLKKDEPIYQASVRTGKHNDPVWQVVWQVRGGGGVAGEKEAAGRGPWRFRVDKDRESLASQVNGREALVGGGGWAGGMAPEKVSWLRSPALPFDGPKCAGSKMFSPAPDR